MQDTVVTRSPLRFRQRMGLDPTPSVPRPRLDFASLRLRTLPLASPAPLPYLGVPFEGSPPPDRPGQPSWPPESGD